MSLIKKERKKKERYCLNFYLTGEDEELYERMETLRHRDRWTMTRFLREACMEYTTRHMPGNPAIPLTHWTHNEPLSIAAKEKLTTKAHEVKCECGGRENCGKCAGQGTYYEEAA